MKRIRYKGKTLKPAGIDLHDRYTWRSDVRSAMHAASQLSGRRPTDVDIAPVPGWWGWWFHIGQSQGPVVQSVVSLTSLLRVISLTVLADSIYNILIFFAEKMWVAFALHFFSKKFQHICVLLNVNFNESLTNDVVSFVQLGPVFHIYVYQYLQPAPEFVIVQTFLMSSIFYNMT